jgi:hypothetical protein
MGDSRKQSRQQLLFEQFNKDVHESHVGILLQPLQVADHHTGTREDGIRARCTMNAMTSQPQHWNSNATLTSHQLPQLHQPDFILPRLVATGQVLCHANVAAETPALIDFCNTFYRAL